jgi:ankyrin repeat protein
MRRIALIIGTLGFLGAAGAAVAADISRSPAAFTVMGAVKKLPNGGRPLKPVPFPAIHDWSTLKFTLSRGGCLGDCPHYTVEIDGDGTVKFDGGGFVAIAGKHNAKISDQQVQKLYAAFQHADFFMLFDHYQAPITDFPVYDVSIEFDGHKMAVEDYVGRAIGMPDVVSELEDLVDEVAGTEKWVKGNAETLQSLRAEGWDFRSRSDDNTQLIASAAVVGNTEFVKQLLAAGVPVDGHSGCEGLTYAANSRNVVLVRLLIEAGAPVHVAASNGKDQDSCDVLSAAADWGAPEAMRLILQRHPDLNWRGFRGETALMLLADNDFAEPEIKDRDLGAAASLLIAAGADVNARDLNGESALMKAHDDVGLVRVLLAASAKDLNRRDGSGNTPLMNSTNPLVSLELLKAGADPSLRNLGGKTALDIATSEKYRKTAPVLMKWLREHKK